MPELSLCLAELLAAAGGRMPLALLGRVSSVVRDDDLVLDLYGSAESSDSFWSFMVRDALATGTHRGWFDLIGPEVVVTALGRAALRRADAVPSAQLKERVNEALSGLRLFAGQRLQGGPTE